MSEELENFIERMDRDMLMYGTSTYSLDTSTNEVRYIDPRPTIVNGTTTTGVMLEGATTTTGTGFWSQIDYTTTPRYYTDLTEETIRDFMIGLTSQRSVDYTMLTGAAGYQNFMNAMTGSTQKLYKSSKYHKYPINYRENPKDYYIEVKTLKNKMSYKTDNKQKYNIELRNAEFGVFSNFTKEKL